MLCYIYIASISKLNGKFNRDAYIIPRVYEIQQKPKLQAMMVSRL